MDINLKYTEMCKNLYFDNLKFTGRWETKLDFVTEHKIKFLQFVNKEEKYIRNVLYGRY